MNSYNFHPLALLRCFMSVVVGRIYRELNGRTNYPHMCSEQSLMSYFQHGSKFWIAKHFSKLGKASMRDGLEKTQTEPKTEGLRRKKLSDVSSTCDNDLLLMFTFTIVARRKHIFG